MDVSSSMHDIHTFTSLTVRVTDILAIAHGASSLIAAEPTFAGQAFPQSTIARAIALPRSGDQSSRAIWTRTAAIARKQQAEPASRVTGAPHPIGTSPRLPTPPDASSPIDCVCVRAGEELALHVSDRSRVDQKLLASLSDCLSKAYAAEWTGSSGEFYRSEIHSLSSQTVSVQNAMMRTRRMVS